MRPFDQLDRRGFVAALRLETGTAVLLLLVSGCSTTALAPQPAIDLPRYVAPSAAKPPRVALVLSGGSARGFAHIGVLRVLEREGLRPDLVVGTSVGAIIGGLYASGLSVGAIEALGEQLNWFTVFDIDPVDSILSGLGLGLAKGKRLEAFLRRAMHAPMHLFPTQFAAVATDLNSGQTVVLNYGDAALAMRASSAIPGMLEPVEIGGRLLGDGQIVSPMPVEVARQLGARVVIAVDVVYPPQQSNLTSPVSVLFQTMVISSWRHLQSQRQQADLVLSPVIEVSGQPGLSDRVWLIKAGIAAAEAGLPQLKAVLSGRRMERL